MNGKVSRIAFKEKCVCLLAGKGEGISRRGEVVVQVVVYPQRWVVPTHNDHANFKGDLFGSLNWDSNCQPVNT